MPISKPDAVSWDPIGQAGVPDSAPLPKGFSSATILHPSCAVAVRFPVQTVSTAGRAVVPPCRPSDEIACRRCRTRRNRCPWQGEAGVSHAREIRGKDACFGLIARDFIPGSYCPMELQRTASLKSALTPSRDAPAGSPTAAARNANPVRRLCPLRRPLPGSGISAHFVLRGSPRARRGFRPSCAHKDA